MPIIEGEKYACVSCIKGHRVSGCTHNDRELHHINPKGRPVKQCEHCRGARKSKSHHAKCDCGEKKDKDKHKDKGLAKVDEERCSCHSGAKCICGLKKDNLDLEIDTGRQTLHGARTKPKLTSTHSESTLTIFANGHHKPCHRNNNSAHVSGMPYKIPRPHTLHGPSAFAAFSQGNLYGRPDAPVQRSMDTHSLSNNDFHTSFGSAQRHDHGLPITPLTGALDNIGIQDLLFTSQGTTLGQDGASPSESQSSDTISPPWPWPTTVTPVTRNFSYGSISTSPSQDCLPNLDNDWIVPSAPFDNLLWSAGDLPLDSSKLADNPAQPTISHSGESKQSGPGLTTGSSAQSEIGESVLFGDLDFRNPPSAANESLFWEDSPVYRLATSAPSEALPPPTSVPQVNAAEGQGLELDASPFKGDIGFAPNTLAFSNATVGDVVASKDLNALPSSISTAADFNEPRALTIPNNIDDLVSNDPWLLDQNSNTFGGLHGFDASYSNWL